MNEKIVRVKLKVQFVRLTGDRYYILEGLTNREHVAAPLPPPASFGTLERYRVGEQIPAHAVNYLCREQPNFEVTITQ